MPKLPPQLTEAIESILKLRPVNRRVSMVNQLLPFDEDAILLNKAAEVLARSSRPEYPYSFNVKHGTSAKFKGLPVPRSGPRESKNVFTTTEGGAASTYATNHHAVGPGAPGAPQRVYDLMLMAKKLQDLNVDWAVGSKTPGVAQFFMHGGQRGHNSHYPTFVSNTSDMLVPRSSPEGVLREALRGLTSRADDLPPIEDNLISSFRWGSANFERQDQGFQGPEEIVGSLLGLRTKNKPLLLPSVLEKALEPISGEMNPMKLAARKKALRRLQIRGELIRTEREQGARKSTSHSRKRSRMLRNSLFEGKGGGVLGESGMSLSDLVQILRREAAGDIPF